MVTYGKKLLALVLAAALALGCGAVFAPQVQAASGFTAAGGWNESLYAEIDGIDDASVTAVSYTGAMSGQLVGQDLAYLVRNAGSGVRIDIPGLKPGTYSLTVTAGGVTYSQSGIEVTAYDRSGYAHWNYTEGVGAYKDDGTLKENATVLYVTQENKNTVSLTAGGLTVTGIGNILNSSGKESSNGLTSKGGKANTNGDILKKLAAEGRPLVVRIVGRVSAPEGVSAWGSYDYGGNPDDNGGMAGMHSCKNITIEGIGPDATVDGWGFSIGSQTGDYARGNNRNFEFRNLTFRNVPEDCIGISGKGSGFPISDPIEHAWVHNCSFYGPSGLPDASADQDKSEGDGAVDFKWGQYYTMSYCYFESYHKTHLIGGGDTNQQFHVTWHHNYYKNCQSRAPLGRNANMHVYNNLTEGQSSYCMSLRANCYIFSEYNTYINCSNISSGSNGGVCKSYNNTFTNCTGTSAVDLKIVTDKNQSVTSGNRYAGFESDASLGYVATGNYLLETDTAAAAANVKANAGPMKPGSLGEGGSSGDTPTPGEGDYIHNFTENGLSSSFYTITGNLSAKGTVNYNGLSLTQCLKLESATSITFRAPSKGTLVLVFHETGYNGAVANQQTVSIDGSRVSVSEDNTLSVSLEAGEHTVKRGSAQIFLYYMFFSPAPVEEHQHSYTSAVTTEPGCVTDGVRTFTCECGDSYTEVIPATGHSYTQTVTAPTCTAQGYTTYTCHCGDSYTDNFVPAAGHSFVNGKCERCGEADPDYVSPEIPDGFHKGEDGKFYYYLNGSVAADFTGLVENSAGKWYVKNGVVQLQYTGNVEFEGTKYLIKGGTIWNFTGIKKVDGTWTYYDKGINDTRFAGLVVCNGMLAYVENGEVNFNKKGLVEYEGELHYVKYGIVSFGFTGMVKDDAGVYRYIKNGKFDASFEGVAKVGGLWVYVTDGLVNFGYDGIYESGGVSYNIENGIVKFA